MALRFVDSFAHYAIASVQQKWTNQNNSGSESFATATPRFSGGSYWHIGYAGNQTHYLQKVLDAQATWIVGFAFRTNANTIGSHVIAALYDGTTFHVDLRIGTNGKLVVTRNGTTLATGSTVLNSDTWYYIEWKTTISDSAGVVAVQIDGVAETLTFVTGNATNQDTRNGGNASADSVLLGGGKSNVGTRADDFTDVYICDASGSVNNDFLGAIRVAPLRPDGAGNSTQFTPDSGSNYARVNETAADGDTSYVESSTAGHKDLYTLGNLPTVPTAVKGIQIVTQDRKTDAGARTIRHVVRTGGTDYESASITQADGYAMHMTIREVNPGTTSAWAESEINGLEAGVKLQS